MKEIWIETILLADFVANQREFRAGVQKWEAAK
jgi:hypothetical protein